MLNLAKRVAEEVRRIGAGVSLPEVSVEAGDLGPVIVLAGDADSSSVTQLNEVLIAQVSGRTRHLTIDATNLRSIDSATAQTLMLAAPIVMVRGRQHGASGPAGARTQDAEPHTRNRDVHDPEPDASAASERETEARASD